MSAAPLITRQTPGQGSAGAGIRRSRTAILLEHYLPAWRSRTRRSRPSWRITTMPAITRACDNLTPADVYFGRWVRPSSSNAKASSARQSPNRRLQHQLHAA